MLIKFFLGTGSALLLVASFTPALADSVNGASTNGTAAVVVLNSITIVQTQSLDFGAITSGDVGTVQIDAITGSRKVGGGVGAIAQVPGQSGGFLVTGTPNASINIVVGGAITGFGGGITGVTQVAALPTVLSGKTASFPIGGLLNIPARTPPGQYSGSYIVTVNYP